MMNKIILKQNSNFLFSFNLKNLIVANQIQRINLSQAKFFNFKIEKKMSDLVQPAKSAYFVRKKPSPAATQPAQAAPAPTSSPAKTANPLNIPGTKTSLQNSQLLTSIGIPSIDSFIGGGLPVGGVCLVGQDQYNNYADIVTRCFIAEGVTHKHSIYVAKLNEDEKSLFQVDFRFFFLKF